MKIAGIIAEFNPFHNGHKRLLSLARTQAGADFVVVILSGNFVQRGVPAFMEKRFRTQAALENGADIVLELPVRYATGSAPVFARGAIAGLLSLGCTSQLVFGSETRLEILSLLASLECSMETSMDFSLYVKEQSRKGLSYPKIRQEYLLSRLPEDMEKESCKEALKSPNSILGIEYLKALSFFDRSLDLHAIPRNDAGYHSTDENVFCSAASLRRQFLSSSFPKEGLPENCISMLEAEYQKSFPILPSDFDLLLYDRLLSWEMNPQSTFQDIDPDSRDRLLNHIRQYEGYESFAALCSQKQKTVTRTFRMLSHLLLRIPQFYPEPFSKECSSQKDGRPPSGRFSTGSDHYHDPQSRKNRPGLWIPYLRLLGMKKEASLCLKKASVPVVTKLAAAGSLFPDKKLPAMLQEDILASRLYQQAVRSRYKTSLTDEYRTSPLILP